jgi:glycosyltransferase involved in cell wall biosynthesis
MANVADLKRLGFEVHLLAMAGRRYPYEESRGFYDGRGYAFTLVPYTYRPVAAGRAADLALMDGEAWTYGQPEIIRAFDGLSSAWQPDIVWCHTTATWPVAKRARLRGIPTVIRSTDYGPRHLIDERGGGFLNQVRASFKRMSERRAMRWASVMAAISPDEADLYRRIDGRTPVHLLPLRTLPPLVEPRQPGSGRQPLRAFFMGSVLRGGHNRRALDFLIGEVAPRLRQRSPGQVEVHVLGREIPAEVRAQAGPDLVMDGYVDDLGAFLASMDIAVMPAPTGTGMQQKVFEALCRGFPVVTSRRAIGGYAFEEGRDVLLADDADGFAAQIARLADPALRNELAVRAGRRSAELFSQAALDQATQAILKSASP